MTDRKVCACCGGAANPQDKWNLEYSPWKLLCKACWYDPSPTFGGRKHGRGVEEPKAVELLSCQDCGHPIGDCGGDYVGREDKSEVQ